jgi:methylmalonyl-CoA mutase N-terminal domain/subunit
MPRLSFFFAAQNDLIEEVAKFRAARQLWAHIARDRFGARDPRSQMLRFHTQTAGVTLTAQQPQNNVVRVTLQALAAVLGGTQSLHTNAMDEALALPTESSATVALRTQQILAYESGVADIVDPLAGSYAVESLTARLADEAASLIERIDEMGGALAAIESGWVQSEVAESAYRYQRAVDSGERIVVGVNRFADRQASTRQADVLRIDPAVAAERVRDLARYRARRDETKLCRSLDGLRAAAHGCDNVVPSLVDAVACGATIGEICDVLRSELGQHTGATDA